MEKRLRELSDLTLHSKKRNRTLKLKLLEEYGKCFWCDKEVKDYGQQPDGWRTPNDTATLDHMVSRLFRKKGESVLKVLACSWCNTRRSQIERSI